MLAQQILNKINQFKRENQRISIRRLRSLTLANKNIPFKIWGETLEGDSYEGREVFTFFGPSRNPGVQYPYSAMGYMIMYDMMKGEPRTFVYDNIYRLELNGVTYEVN